jgi:leucyl/phenylalanyl-tRNA--protein transferase
VFYLLDPKNPQAPFPPVDRSEREPNGLLAIGGDLSPARLLNAYRSGIFPWYSEDQPILWWSPDPRMVLFPDRLKVSRSLAKTLRNGGFEVSFDQVFGQVIDGCAGPRKDEQGTWITEEMQHAYIELHRLGHAHSVEIWRRGELAGGLYGVALGRVFFGESMFSRERDASKVALVHLSGRLRDRGYRLIDCQVYSSHLISLGAETIDRREFCRYLERWCSEPNDWTGWGSAAVE